MGLVPRTQLHKVDPIIKSSYSEKGGTGGSRAALFSLAGLKGGLLTPDAVTALLDLHTAVEEAGGDLRITDAYRDADVQAAARKKYENWLGAGKPPRKIKGKANPKFDAETMKDAYVARPGRSFHNAGRAIDIHVVMLKLGKKKDLYLDKLWPIAKGLGWRPIIKEPDEGAKESWHFDFMGEWAPVYDRLGYSQAALCACLDIGAFNVTVLAREKAIQAHLHRAGYDVGDIDGIIGRRTLLGLGAAGIGAKQRALQYDEVVKLESSADPKFIG
jgi:hypothetical protein